MKSGFHNVLGHEIRLAGLPSVLLINPNASQSTTDMMVDIAAAEARGVLAFEGATAQAGPSMIVTEAELRAAAAQVLDLWHAAGDGWAGVIISAFGDPGIARLQRESQVPVVGIAEASMREASQGGRRFGIATVTPELVPPIEARAFELGLRELYTGIRLTAGDPRKLAADPRALQAALGEAVQRCIDEDGAEAVVIGGGPLGQAALGLARQFSVPVIAPISAAVRLLRARLGLTEAA